MEFDHLDDLPTVEEFEASKLRPKKSEWIKELEEKAKSKYKQYKKGFLFEEDFSQYTVEYKNGRDSVWLSRTFTIEQLEALIKHMKKYNV